MTTTALDPVPLHVLAEHLAERTWLDMRVVEKGLLRRVRIFEIRIHLDGEDIGAEQDYYEGTEVKRQEHVFPQDAVMWARPTSFDERDIDPPWALSPGAAELSEGGRAWQEFKRNPLTADNPYQEEYNRKRIAEFRAKHPELWVLRNNILLAASIHWQTDVAAIMTESTQPSTVARKFAMRLMWELSDYGQTDIPILFGYRSGGMMSSALTGTKDDPKTVRSLLEQTEKLLGDKWSARRGHLGPGSRQVKLL